MSFANLYTRIKFVILYGKEEKQKLTVMIIKVLQSNKYYLQIFSLKLGLPIFDFKSRSVGM